MDQSLGLGCALLDVLGLYGDGDWVGCKGGLFSWLGFGGFVR